MLALIALPGIGRDAVPGLASVGRGSQADLLPTLDCIVGCEAEVPGARHRRGRDTSLALRHGRSAYRTRNACSLRCHRLPQLGGELGVTVDLGRGPPLFDQLGEGGKVVDLGRCDNHTSGLTEGVLTVISWP